MTTQPALADLHRHLDGSLRPDTVAALADALGVAVPDDLGFSPGMGLEAALAQFAFTVSLLQTPDSVRRVAAEMCEDALSENVTTLEIRFAPQLHQGAAIEEIVDAALDGIDGRAGLILCALYSQSPDIAERLVAAGAPRTGVVALDLAAAPIPGNPWSIEDYAPAFVEAARQGLGRTVHAGEGQPASQIKAAIEVLGAQRIGHGCSLLDDPALLELVLAKGVTIEACPTSNTHTDVFDSIGQHPLPRWLSLGVRACICTDNTLLSQVNAPQEYARAASIPGMTPQLMELATRWGHDGAFRR